MFYFQVKGELRDGVSPNEVRGEAGGVPRGSQGQLGGTQGYRGGGGRGAWGNSRQTPRDSQSDPGGSGRPESRPPVAAHPQRCCLSFTPPPSFEAARRNAAAAQCR